jgi:ribonuclease P protein component
VQRWLRLQRSEDFRRIRETGKAYHHAWLILSVAPGENPTNRYGFITGKKLGGAVIRNRMRRRLKEALRLLHLRLKQGYDMVVIARPAIVGQPFAAIQVALEKLCEQAGIVVKDSL